MWAKSAAYLALGWRPRTDAEKTCLCGRSTWMTANIARRSYSVGDRTLEFWLVRSGLACNPLASFLAGFAGGERRCSKQRPRHERLTAQSCFVRGLHRSE